MKRKNIIILFFVIFLCTSNKFLAQPGPKRWPIENDYCNIELNLLLKGSNGEAIVFNKENKNKILSSKKGYSLESFFIEYRLATKNGFIDSDSPKFYVEMEDFYEQIYKNHPDDYIEWMKKIFTPVRHRTSPGCSDGFHKHRSEKVACKEYKSITADTLCYRFAASDNIVYAVYYHCRFAERTTPYFVPIGDLEIVLKEKNKLMRVTFELYDYKKMGFLQRTPVDENRFEYFPFRLFMEIQFQEGDFVVTDESYPNLIKKE